MLTGREAQILIQLRSGDWTTNELKNFFGMQRTNVCRALRELKRLGYVEKKSRRTKEDLRKRFHKISDEGKRYLVQVYGK